MDDKDDKPPKEEEAWMVMVMDDCAMDEYLYDMTCEGFDKSIINSRTNYSPNHDFDLPNLFDGIDESLDGFDEVIDSDQDLSAEPADEVITSLNAAYLAGTDETRSAEVDLYDSGTTRHMSGFFHRFFNYVIMLRPNQSLL